MIALRFFFIEVGIITHMGFSDRERDVFTQCCTWAIFKVKKYSVDMWKDIFGALSFSH